jgi:hypothetical protein
MTNEEITEEIKAIQLVRNDLKKKIEARKKWIDTQTRELQRLQSEDASLQSQQLNLRDSLQVALS